MTEQHPDGPYGKYTDVQVVEKGWNGLAAADVEMMRRLRATLVEQHTATTELNQKLLNLNIQLRNFTVGLYFIGGVQLILFIYQLFIKP
jgi:hypothetical protein